MTGKKRRFKLLVEFATILNLWVDDGGMGNIEKLAFYKYNERAVLSY